MANLIINEYDGIAAQFQSPMQIANRLIATQVVAIGESSVASAALNAETQMVRIYAEADCSFLIGTTPVVTTSSGVPMTAKTADYFVAGGGQKIAAIARTVS
jgi:hypothetical protein